MATQSISFSETVTFGFTLAEIMIVLVIIGILVAINLPMFFGSSARSRDAERANDVATIASELERSYRATAATAGPSYPPTNASTATTIATIIGNNDSITAPKATSNSIIPAASASPQHPSGLQYIYQSFNAAGALCTAAPCVRFILYYYHESHPAETRTLHSMRQQ
ncbi:MAG: prepilin-type N-terminal cleavage/methylation domain-containing protein [Candidatus Saccharibacteria bacterium]|nr:prepilin-type N-terminal cleavage/methylation domain-containing protein [Candidatus Saccharibacteria bacterium]